MATYVRQTPILEFRGKVMKDSADGMSQRKLAEKYGCSESHIEKILQNKCDIMDWSQSVVKNTKKKSYQSFGSVNKLTLLWYETTRSKGIAVNGPMLLQKAKDYAVIMREDAFTATSEWVQTFCSTNDILLHPICAEKPSANVDDEEVSECVNGLLDILKDYNARDIYNVDETSLFFRGLPEKTPAVEGPACVKGSNEDRITVLLCANAVGEKEPPIIINRSLKSKSHKNVNINNLSAQWYTNEDAWMTQDIFTQFLRTFDERMKNEGRYIVILLDNAPCHPTTFKLSNINLVFLTANTSSKLQPLNQGIIQTFKLYYRERILSTLLARMTVGESVHGLAKTITISDAIYWICQAWRNVSKQIISKCFAVCGVAADFNGADINTEIFEIQNKICSLGEKLKVEIDLNFDERAQTCDDSTDADLELINESTNITEIRPSSTTIGQTNGEEEEATSKQSENYSIPLTECLRSVDSLKRVARELGNNKLLDTLCSVEVEFKKEISKEKVTAPNTIKQ